MKKAPSAMDSGQINALVSAHRSFNTGPLTADMAVPVISAVSAGWSRRTITGALGIPRERTERLCAFTPPALMDLPRYRRGEGFPREAVDAYKTAEDRSAASRREAAARLSGLIRAARAAGYSYNDVGEALGTSGEWARKLADPDPSKDIPDVFTPLPEPRRSPARGHLSEDERDRMRGLADEARRASRIGPRTSEITADEHLAKVLRARQASEKLSAMITGAKARKVTWAEIDEACGYAPGSARARAKRHGYGSRPQSIPAYTPTDPELLKRAGLDAD